MVLACLSPNEMRISEQVGYYAAALCAVIGAVILLVSWRQRSFASLPICLLLLVVHPAWSMDVFSGDCGFVKRLFSVGVSTLFIVLFGLQIFRPQFNRRRFVFVFSVVCWSLCVLLWLQRLIHIPLYGGTGFFGELIDAFMLSSGDMLMLALECTVIYLVWSRIAKLRHARQNA